jgi:hypothetical protein
LSRLIGFVVTHQLDLILSFIYGYMEIQIMDEFTQRFTLNELIEKYQKEHITFTTIYICKDEHDGIVIAVSWKDHHEMSVIN